VRTLVYTVEKLEVNVRLHMYMHMYNMYMLYNMYMCHVCKFWMDDLDGPGTTATHNLHASTPHQCVNQCAMRGVRGLVTSVFS
jgi:hypothetical protein